MLIFLLTEASHKEKTTGRDSESVHGWLFSLLTINYSSVNNSLIYG